MINKNNYTIGNAIHGSDRRKCRKIDHDAPIAFARLWARHGKPAPIWIKVLFDSRAS